MVLGSNLMKGVVIFGLGEGMSVELGLGCSLSSGFTRIYIDFCMSSGVHIYSIVVPFWDCPIGFYLQTLTKELPWSLWVMARGFQVLLLKVPFCV